MKKFLPWIIVAGIVLALVFWVISARNQAMRYNQGVEKEWGNVETAYQRRNDLIGNLVNTVKGAADFERETLTAVTEARARATSVNIDPTNITPDKLAEFQQAQAGVSSTLSRLLVSVERYPDLKANQNFLKLQDELASTENQILTARTRFNESVQIYNSYVLTSPRDLVLGKYTEKPYFKSVESADRPVEVQF